MERLGWKTSCQDRACVQVWLTRCILELPFAAKCPKCGFTVRCAHEAQAGLSAHPVIAPMSNRPSGRRALTAEEMPPAPQVPLGRGEIPAGFGAPEPVDPLDLAEPEPPDFGATGSWPGESSVPAPPPRPNVRGQWAVSLDSGGPPIPIEKDHVILGRSRSCDIIIPSAKVSRQHASLTWIEGELFVEDMGSANGVFMNGRRVTRQRLSLGDVLVLSDETLTIVQA